MIRLTDIHKEYQNGTKALKGVSLQIDDGEFVFLVGPSGSGKSTIIKLITAEIEATRGKLMVNGYNLPGHQRETDPPDAPHHWRGVPGLPPHREENRL